MKKKITAIIPALNEENTIVDVICGVKKYVDEVILINDASTDNTLNLVLKQDVVVLSHNNTEGYDKSIDDGFVLAAERGADIILTFDADGQHNPEDIRKIVEPLLNEEADIVVGRRPYCARITEYLFKFISKIKLGISDPLCGLKGYCIKVYRDIGYFDRISSIGTQLIFSAKKKGYRIKQQNISVTKRADQSRFGRKLKANWKILRAIKNILLRG